MDVRLEYTVDTNPGCPSEMWILFLDIPDECRYSRWTPNWNMDVPNEASAIMQGRGQMELVLSRSMTKRSCSSQYLPCGPTTLWRCDYLTGKGPGSVRNFRGEEAEEMRGGVGPNSAPKSDS